MTDEGDAVFDPYLGVGSSAVAALKHGRSAWGCDTEARYIEIARDRIDRLQEGTLKTRPMDKPIYDPALPNGGHRCGSAGAQRASTPGGHSEQGADGALRRR